VHAVHDRLIPCAWFGAASKRWFCIRSTLRLNLESKSYAYVTELTSRADKTLLIPTKNGIPLAIRCDKRRSRLPFHLTGTCFNKT
jgi:hypothetical protein